MATKRIEYIDAMRGLTMILVVYSHICRYCLGDWTMGRNDVFFLFRLPCFFFISGWLFENVDRQWNSVSIRHTIRHKFMVQIVPTFIFLLLLAGPSLFVSRLGATKGGYWFTFALFEFFLIQIFSERYLKRWGGLFALLISVAAFSYDIFYNQLVHNGILDLSLITHHFSLQNVLGFLSFMTWRYYLFFYIGTWVKRHFDTYIYWTSKRWVVACVVLGFVLIALTKHLSLITYHLSLLTHHLSLLIEYLMFSVGGILGMTMVFTFFRHFAAWFTKDKPLGRVLQYIGMRTLDIYLLHYFILPRFLLFHTDWLREADSKPLEFLVAFLLALLVVGICLLVSRIICLSPLLGHILFGKKMPKG